MRETEDFGANYRAMETMAMEMRRHMAGYATTIYHPELFPNATTYSYGLTFMPALFEDVLFHLDSIEYETHRQTRITNLYLDIATILSTM